MEIGRVMRARARRGAELPSKLSNSITSIALLARFKASRRLGFFDRAEPARALMMNMICALSSGGRVW